ncbi:hypothetical protein UFOVP126_64 [uncultured Caudovirales phage]|uniref:Uncharacterized protein n=1 Tax=uncultured Caudovirales phage TaxID=2100421 RepID=A0A6J5LDA5_9CAUD|nr:hypothetical protein UFOVP126_64 [uncultured Caudovirales phage]
MTDRELLEKAAKAAGLAVIIPAAHQRGLWIEGLEDEWNPLTDDGDALRLAVKLNIVIWECAQYDRAMAEVRYGAARGEYWEPVGKDPHAATRRAIVRAAAQIGEHMEKQNGN